MKKKTVHSTGPILKSKTLKKLLNFAARKSCITLYRKYLWSFFFEFFPFLGTTEKLENLFGHIFYFLPRALAILVKKWFKDKELILVEFYFVGPELCSDKYISDFFIVFLVFYYSFIQKSFSK